MVKHNVATVLVAVGAVFGCVVVACSSDSAGTPTTTIPGNDSGLVDTGTIPPIQEADTGAVLTLTLAPASGKLLTCTGKVDVGVNGASSASAIALDVTSTPAGIGALGTTDADAGAFGATWDAPKSVPANASFTLNASLSNTSTSVSGSYTLGTAFPSAPITVTGSTGNGGESFGVYPHWSAASGNRVYAIWPDKQDTSGKIMLSRSDDGGATWLATPITALTATFTDGANSSILCASLAIDAANPDIVYVLAEFTNSNSFATSVGADGDSLVLGVSTDGGKTFTPRVIQVGGSADGPDNLEQVGVCGDVTSPAANTVVVESPASESAFTTPDMALWFDTTEGAGFATGTLVGDDYVAAGFQDSLQNVNNAADENHRLDIGQDGGGSETGAATESPRLATDGKGNICLTFVATQNTPTPAGPSLTNSYIMCSKNNGKTFSSLVTLDPADGALPHAHAIAAMGPNNKVAVVWTNGADPNAALKIARSTDGGATFGTPAVIPTYPITGIQGSPPALTPSLAYDAGGILWLAYAPYDGNVNDRIVVDKSCDDGATWSGAVLVNGPEGSIKKMQWPSLAMTTSAPHVFTMAEDHMSAYSLAP